jgi:hypothetical protein
VLKNLGKVDSINIGKDKFISGGDYLSNEPGYGSSDQMLFEREYKTYYSDSIVPEEIKNIVRNYIIQRGGKTFYSILKFEKVLITNIDSIKKFDAHSYLLKNNGNGVKKGRIKYHFEYSFFPEKNVIYAFGISIDEKGKIISKDVIPKFENDLDLSKTIKLCVCVENIRKKYIEESKFPLSSIKFHFNKRKNTFCYSITFSDSPLKTNQQGTIKCNYYTINSDFFTGKLSNVNHSVGNISVEGSVRFLKEK